jgi:hypothetical protein
MKLAAVLVGLLLCCSSGAFGGDTQDCRMQVDTAVDEFIDTIFDVSRLKDPELSPEERDRHYEQAVQKLLKAAKDWGVENKLLKDTLKEYVEFTEANRKPPIGWDWNDRAADLVRYSEHAKTQVRLDLELISFARRFCHRRGEVGWAK